MLKKTCFSLASVAALGGMVWATSAAGCSSSDTTPAADPDSGGGSSSGGGKDSGGTPTEDSSTTTNDSGGGEKDTGTTVQGVKITYGKCAAFTKCASDPVGSWKVSGGCLSDDTFAEAKVKCPGLQESNVNITANGTVTVSATNVTRDSSTTVTASVLIPKTCANGASCALVQTGLTSGFVPGVPTFDTATCKDSGANCDCDVSLTLAEKSNDTYTSAKDGTLTTSGPQGDRTFDYCVAASKLTYEETTAKSLPLIVEMTKN